MVYEPVKLAQDFRTFDFTSPWEGAEYVLPGDEKGSLPEAKGAPTPLNADQVQKADAAQSPVQRDAAPSEPYEKKGVESTAETGAGKPHPHIGEKPADPDVVPGKGGQNQ